MFEAKTSNTELRALFIWVDWVNNNDFCFFLLKVYSWIERPHIFPYLTKNKIIADYISYLAKVRMAQEEKKPHHLSIVRGPIKFRGAVSTNGWLVSIVTRFSQYRKEQQYAVVIHSLLLNSKLCQAGLNAICLAFHHTKVLHKAFFTWWAGHKAIAQVCIAAPKMPWSSLAFS